MVNFNYFIIFDMKTLINEIAIFYNIDYSSSLYSKIKSHIYKASFQIFLVVNVLIIFDNLLRFLFSLVGKKKFYISIVIKHRPPVLSLLYKLITSLIILISFEKK